MGGLTQVSLCSTSLLQDHPCQELTGMECLCMGLSLGSLPTLSLYLGSHLTCSQDISNNNNLPDNLSKQVNNHNLDNLQLSLNLDNLQLSLSLDSLLDSLNLDNLLDSLNKGNNQYRLELLFLFNKQNLNYVMSS